MNTIINEMLAKYDVVTFDDCKNVMKEIIHEIVLCGGGGSNEAQKCNLSGRYF